MSATLENRRLVLARSPALVLIAAAMVLPSGCKKRAYNEARTASVTKHTFCPQRSERNRLSLPVSVDAVQVAPGTPVFHWTQSERTTEQAMQEGPLFGNDLESIAAYMRGASTYAYELNEQGKSRSTNVMGEGVYFASDPSLYGETFKATPSLPSTLVFLRLTAEKNAQGEPVPAADLITNRYNGALTCNEIDIVRYNHSGLAARHAIVWRGPASAVRNDDLRFLHIRPESEWASPKGRLRWSCGTSQQPADGESSCSSRFPRTPFEIPPFAGDVDDLWNFIVHYREYLPLLGNAGERDSKGAASQLNFYENGEISPEKAKMLLLLHEIDALTERTVKPLQTLQKSGAFPAFKSLGDAPSDIAEASNKLHGFLSTVFKASMSKNASRPRDLTGRGLGALLDAYGFSKQGLSETDDPVDPVLATKLFLDGWTLAQGGPDVVAAKVRQFSTDGALLIKHMSERSVSNWK